MYTRTTYARLENELNGFVRPIPSNPTARAAGFGANSDDEALLLYALVKVMRLRRILEVGGLHGYSARNFLKAVGNSGTVYTVDLTPVVPQAENHTVITKDARLLAAEDVDSKALDLVFFDCHVFKAQMELYFRLSAENIITPNTVLALHDTNLHPCRFTESSYEVEGGGFLHQFVERQMADDFRRLGYDAISFHTELNRHDADLPYRHGVTILRKYRTLGIYTTPIRILRHHAAILLARAGWRSLWG